MTTSQSGSYATTVSWCPTGTPPASNASVTTTVTMFMNGPLQTTSEAKRIKVGVAHVMGLVALLVLPWYILA